MTETTFRRSRIALVAVLALMIGACSFGADTAESSAGGGFAAFETTTTAAASEDMASGSDGQRGEAEAPADEGAADEDALGSGGITPAVVADVADLGRDIVFTSAMTVAVDDVAAAGSEATRIVQSLGGFLFGQQTTGSPEPRSVLVFKVFPEDFQMALDRLGSIGDLRTQNVTADDVTERVVDLRSRITTAEASVQRLRGFLENATDIDAIADLENQLLQRETQLETLRGQLRTLEDAVSLATITLTITQNAIRPAVRVDVSAYSGADDGGLSCPGSASLTVDQGTDVTVCFEIVNVGDTALTDFTLHDPVIDVSQEDLIPVFGDMSQTLEPGESIVAAAHITADRSWRTQTNVTALPVDEDGNVLAGRSVANTATISISAVDPGGVPGFGAGLERSVELLVTLGQLLVYLVAILLPFAWIPLAAWWILRRRREAGDGTSAKPQPAGTTRAEPAEQASVGAEED